MKLILSLALAALVGSGAVTAQAETDVASLPQTASHKAYAELRKAQRKDGKLLIEMRFITDDAGYSGEMIYDEAHQADIHIKAGGTDYALAKDDDAAFMAPQTLKLKFNYDPKKNPRVGSWKATFEAPPKGVDEATLVLPNMAVIGPFAITDR